MSHLAALVRLLMAVGLVVALSGRAMVGSAAPARPGTASGAAFQTDDDDTDDDDDGPGETPGTGQTAASGPTFPVGVFAGTSDDLDGAPLHRLEDATLQGDDDDDDDDGGTGRIVGAMSAIPVAVSDSEITARLGDLLRRAHAVAVFAGPGSDGAPLACGEVGEFSVDGDGGGLLLALREQNDSGAAGIAVLGDDDDGELDVAIYLGSPDAAAAGVARSTREDGGAAGVATRDDATETAPGTDDEADDDGGDDEADDDGGDDETGDG